MKDMTTEPPLYGNHPITEDQLPATVRQFIAKFFDTQQVAQVAMDKDPENLSYQVSFTDGSMAKFNAEGQWTHIESKSPKVPNGIVPWEIEKFLYSAYADTDVTRIERTPRDYYTVELDTGLELTFNEKYILVNMER